ncbi:unnamed protein product [Adineta steineri]|uniref:G-protein coupled receptors family 1 profile domain-containing protein n=1 Tax=Adineta steineri TaxID=433720 RepID=A0A818UDL5_9BILA|nr:unnamed protein product [Adineta steineri]CAF3696890.1 unnamed protein product [Adineta steineri]
MSTSTQIFPTLATIQTLLVAYAYPTMLVLGILGNSINIYIFLRKKLVGTSCNNYFLATAITNLIILNIGIISFLYTYYQSWAITTIYCQIRTYFFHASQQMSRYFLVMACFDRFALCSTHVYLRKFSHIRIARRYVIPSTIIFWLIVPIHIPIFYYSINNTCAFSGVAAFYQRAYNLVVTAFLPPGLMLIFSILTFRNLKLRNQRRQIYPITPRNFTIFMRKTRQEQIKNQQIFVMLLIQVFIYLCSTSLYSVYTLYTFITANDGTNKSNERLSIESFISFTNTMLIYIFPFISFYLFVSVSHTFRKEMKLMIIRIVNQCHTFSINNGNHHAENTINVMYQ